MAIRRLPSVLDKLRGEGDGEHRRFCRCFPSIPRRPPRRFMMRSSAGRRPSAICRVFAIIKDYFRPSRLYCGAGRQYCREYRAQHGARRTSCCSPFTAFRSPMRTRAILIPKRCRCTAAHVAQQLGLSEDQWAIAFQSRFGKQEWVKPYTDVLLEEWAKSGGGVGAGGESGVSRRIAWRRWRSWPSRMRSCFCMRGAGPMRIFPGSIRARIMWG
jgi:ferrochelatase